MGTLLVYLIKPSGKDIRICGNCKININKYLKDFNYPLPRVEDIFCAVQCGKKFTKLDFSNAYNQLLVNGKTKKLLCWSTHKRVYEINGLPFGTRPAYSIFQLIVAKVLLGAKGAVNFLDDIVVTGKN